MKRNLFSFAGVLVMLLALMVLGSCNTDSDDPGSGGGGDGGAAKEIKYSAVNLTIGYISTTYEGRISFFNVTTEEQKAALKALTINSLTVTPSTDGGRTLTLSASTYPPEQDGTAYTFFVKITRSAAPNDASEGAQGTRKTSTLTIADSNGYTFKPLIDSVAQFQW